MARDTPAAPSLCRRNRATCAFAAGGLLRFAYRTSEILRAAARAGVEAPQIMIEQSIGRFSMQVARTPMAWILPVRGIASFALDRHSGRVHDAAEPKAARATGAPRSMPLWVLESSRNASGHFQICPRFGAFGVHVGSIISNLYSILCAHVPQSTNCGAPIGCGPNGLAP
jgi:hypothetical protein